MAKILMIITLALALVASGFTLGYATYLSDITEANLRLAKLGQSTQDMLVALNRCDEVVNTCLYWQARVSMSLDAVEASCNGGKH